MVHYYGTNSYNFIPMPNPPSFEPSLCIGPYKQRIDLGNDGHTVVKDGHVCLACYPQYR